MYEKEAQFIVDTIAQQLRDEDRDVTGATILSLEYEADENGIRILGDEHLQQLNVGRLAGSFPNFSRLETYVAFRNIQWEYEGRLLTWQQAAFLIGRAIAREGSPTSGAIARFGSKIGTIDRAIERIEDEVVDMMEDTVFEFLDI